MILKKLAHSLGLFYPLRDLLREVRLYRKGRRALRLWRANGCPLPPPDRLKYGIIRAYACRHHTPVLVETGTWYGNSVFTLRNTFKEIHTIELAPELYQAAVMEFAHLKHIHCHLGDSTTLLPQVAFSIDEPCLFWLDGHFCAGPSVRGSKDTPISEELEFILNRPQGRHVVLIDDARLFNGSDGYPTIESIREYVLKKRPQTSFTLEDDIIRIVPV